MLRVKNEKQTNKQQQHNKDSVTQSSRVNLTQCCCVTKIFNTWSVILASVQSNLKRKKQLLHLISLVLLQLKGNPGKHLPIKENRWITNHTFSTQNFSCLEKIRHPAYFKQFFMHHAFNKENFKTHHTLPFYKIHASHINFGLNHASLVNPLPISYTNSSYIRMYYS